MNVTSTTTLAVQLIATSTSESLSNDCEKPNQPKRLFFLKCDCGKISVKHAFSLATLSGSGIHKSILEGWLFWKNCWIL